MLPVRVFIPMKLLRIIFLFFLCTAATESKKQLYLEACYSSYLLTTIRRIPQKSDSFFDNKCII